MTRNHDPLRALARRARAAARVTDEYGHHYTLRFMAFLCASSFAAMLVAETSGLPLIV